MAGTNDTRALPVKDLVLWPSVATLAVTLLRLAGELIGGPDALFSRAPGGAGALIGIVWLVPLFGYYFGHRLARLGFRPAGVGRVFGYAVLGLALFAVLAGIGFSLPVASLMQFVLIGAGAWAAVLVVRRGWPALNTVLIAYGLAARIPVAIVMLFAILGRWGTHYDAPPPGLPEGMGPWATWVATGLIPQLTLWIAFTVIVGALFGGLAVFVASRRHAATPAAA
jgi:hypothetical protein